MDDEDKPPIHVFFDIEAMQETGRHVPNLLIAETECDDRPIRFRGDHCLRDFLQWLDTLTENDTCPVTVIAHIFKITTATSWWTNITIKTGLSIKYVTVGN